MTAALGPAHAQQRRGLADPMRLGVDSALVDSGFAAALLRGFGHETGIAIKPAGGPALALLQALERGEIDAVLTNTPGAEIETEKQGFAHERTLVAISEFVIVGPVPTPTGKGKGKGKVKVKPRDVAGLIGLRDAVEALQRLRDATAGEDAIRFVSANDGSGTHVLEQALWRSAKIAPAPPWYVAAEGAAAVLRQARQIAAYALVERGVWSAHGGVPLAMLVQGDPALHVPVHVMRGFRTNHPATRLFFKWTVGLKGRAIIAAQSGYRVPPG